MQSDGNPSKQDPNKEFQNVWEFSQLGALVCDRDGPINAGLVVILNCGAFEGAIHAKILCMMADAFQLNDIFVCSNDFSFVGSEVGLILADGFPGD